MIPISDSERYRITEFSADLCAQFLAWATEQRAAVTLGCHAYIPPALAAIHRTVATALTNPDDRHFGFFIQGCPGNGKTTLADAIRRMICRVIADFRHQLPNFMRATAREIASARIDDPETFRLLMRTDHLLIDDLAQEPAEVLSYGNVFTPLHDLICYRYERRLFTIITSNMGLRLVAEYYDERIADRIAEMCHVLPFDAAPSLRTAPRDERGYLHPTPRPATPSRPAYETPSPQLQGVY